MRRVALFLIIALFPYASVADDLDRPFLNWQAQRFRNVLRQRTDFTCGAASLSIISRHYYGRTVAERQFTDAIRETYTKEEWKEKMRDGLSLLDIKRAAEKFVFGGRTQVDARPIAAIEGTGHCPP